MPAYMLDSGILIRCLRNRPGYSSLLQKLGQDNDLYISAFTRIEVLRGMREHERERTFALLNGFFTTLWTKKRQTRPPNCCESGRRGERL